MINKGFYQHKKKYDFERTLERNKDVINKDDADLIIRYVNEKESVDHIKPVRAYKLQCVLVTWKRFINKPYGELKLDDVLAGIKAMKNARAVKFDHLGNEYEGEQLKPGTVYDYITVLKTFLTWLVENDLSGISERELKKVKSTKKIDASRRLDEKDILTPGEVEKIVKATLTIRDRAILSVLYESGARCGEIARAVWSDLTFDKHGVSMYIDDQKEERKRYTRLFTSTEALSTWRNQHPRPEGQNFVFINPDGSPMTYIGMKRVLERAVKRTGIQKPVSLHMLRHARATHLVQQGYNSEHIKKSLWGNVNTNMFATYVSIGKESIDAEWLRKAGVQVDDGKVEESMMPRTCHQCGRVNAHDIDFCGKCGYPLSEAAKAEERDNDRDIEEFLKDPLKLKRLAEILSLKADGMKN